MSKKPAAAAAAAVVPTAVSPLTVQYFADSGKVQLRIASAMSFELNARRAVDAKFKTIDYVRQVVPALAAAGHMISEKTVQNYGSLANKFCERFTAQLISLGDLSEENVGLFSAFIMEQAKGYTANVDDLSNFASGRPSIAAQAAQAAADKAAAEAAKVAKAAEAAKAAEQSAEQAAAAQAELLKAEADKAAAAEAEAEAAKAETERVKAEAAKAKAELAAAAKAAEDKAAADKAAADKLAAEAELSKQSDQIAFRMNKKGEKEFFIQENISLEYLQECISLLMNKAEELHAAAAAAVTVTSTDVSAALQQPIQQPKRNKGKKQPEAA